MTHSFVEEILRPVDWKVRVVIDRHADNVDEAAEARIRKAAEVAIKGADCLSDFIGYAVCQATQRATPAGLVVGLGRRGRDELLVFVFPERH